MKKTITLSLLFLLGFSLFGQNKNSLNSRILEGYEEYFYFYNEKGLLDSAYYEELNGESYRIYHLYIYDDLGRLIREDGYQDLVNQGGWTYVTKVEYTYDEEGRLSTRMNYNSFEPGEWTLGGKMVWSYNEKGLKSSVETLLAGWTEPDKFDLFSREIYSYNSDDQIVKREFMMVPFSTMDPDDMYLSSKMNYSYTGKNLASIMVENYNEGGTQISSTSREEFSWDDKGNLTQYDSFIGNANNPQTRSIFHYDTERLNAETNLPFNLEENESLAWIRSMMYSPNIILKEELWQEPMNQEELMHVGDYVYSYSSDTHITTPLQDGIVDVMPSMVGDLLMLRGLPEGSKVELFDVSGQHLMSTRYDSQGIDLSALPHGAYMAYSKEMGCFKFLR